MWRVEAAQRHTKSTARRPASSLSAVIRTKQMQWQQAQRLKPWQQPPQPPASGRWCIIFARHRCRQLRAVNHGTAYQHCGQLRLEVGTAALHQRCPKGNGSASFTSCGEQLCTCR